jgi:hypothetical protein
MMMRRLSKTPYFYRVKIGKPLGFYGIEVHLIRDMVRDILDEIGTH